MATPSLPVPPKFAKDSSRLYSLRNVLTGGEVFKFTVSPGGHRITIMAGTNDIGYMTGEQLEQFEDDRFEIKNIGEAPIRNSARVKTGAYREKTALERTNAFIRSQAEKAARANANINNTFSFTRIPGINYNNSSNPETFDELITYFGFENVPENKLDSLIRSVSLFFRSVHNSINITITQFNSKRKTTLPKIAERIPFNINAPAYTDFESFNKSVILLNRLRDMIIERKNDPHVVRKNKLMLKNNSSPREGGGAGGMSGGRRKRQTKRRSMKRRHRTRRH